MAGREIRVPAYIIAVLGEERVAKEIRFISGELKRAGLPVTIEKILGWLEDAAEQRLDA